MKFGEKLQKLRKAKGMSQEELSYQLHVSRQAVSKWENDQGYPETEKMLMIGNIFSVSMDYLLKDQGGVTHDEEHGYYASREMVQGYLAQEEREAKKTGFAVLLLICSGLPILAFPAYEDSLSILSIIIIAIAISIFIWLDFEEDAYKKIVEEPLVFDQDYLREVKDSYKVKEKKLKVIFIGAIMMFFLMACMGALVEDVLHLPEGPHEAIYLILCGMGVYMIIYASCVMSSYEPILDNEKYQREHNGYDWLYYITCGVAAVIYVGLGMMYGKLAWNVGWVMIAIAAIVTAGVIRVLNKKAKK